MKLSALFEVLIANWKDNFKLGILEDSERDAWTGFSWSVNGPLASWCGKGNEPLLSLKGSRCTASFGGCGGRLGSVPVCDIGVLCLSSWCKEREQLCTHRHCSLGLVPGVGLRNRSCEIRCASSSSSSSDPSDGQAAATILFFLLDHLQAPCSCCISAPFYARVTHL